MVGWSVIEVKVLWNWAPMLKKYQNSEATGLAQYFHTENAGCLAGPWMARDILWHVGPGDQVEFFGCGFCATWICWMEHSEPAAADFCVEVYGQDSRELQDHGFVKGRPELPSEPLSKSRHFYWTVNSKTVFECVSVVPPSYPCFRLSAVCSFEALLI